MSTERDARGFWSLPEQQEEQSYYTYGTPAHGAAQFAHPNMLTFLFKLEFWWGHASDAQLGIGNISLANGVKPRDHDSHRSGLEVDIRPIRKDRRREGVTRFSVQYDRQETAKLVSLMWQTQLVSLIYFNDPFVGRVTPYPHHDDHLHVKVLP